MRKVNGKKAVVFGVVLLLGSLMIIPSVNAQIKDSAGKQLQLLENEQDQQDQDDSTYELVIITPRRFAAALRPLVWHKNRVGVPTKLVTLGHIYLTMRDGRDNAEKIKYFIKQAIEEWGIKYVLLVGGMKHQRFQWFLPVRYVFMDDGWEDRYISDLYYADIFDDNGSFSSWDSDGDGRFGEWFGIGAEDKDIDLEPDVAVGRIPVRNIFEVIIMVRKIIRYETKTAGQPWFDDMIVIAGDTYPECVNANWTGYEGEFYADRALENMTGFNQIRLFTSDGTLTGPDDVISAVSQGCGFLYFVGHGNPMTWGNNMPNNKTFIEGLSINHIPRLTNINMLPVCVVSGCHNSQFDVSIFRYLDEHSRYWGEWTPECWGWWLTRKIGGGSIATIGCTALGYTKEDKDSFEGGLNAIEVEFFKQYGQNHIDIVGNTWAAAINGYLDKYSPIDWNTEAQSDSWIDTKVVQSWVLFGDPSLKIGGYA